jgi:hypothetical protein
MFCLLPLEMYPPLSPLQANTGICNLYLLNREETVRKREINEIIVIMPEVADSGHLEVNANDSEKGWELNLFVFLWQLRSEQRRH